VGHDLRARDIAKEGAPHSNERVISRHAAITMEGAAIPRLARLRSIPFGWYYVVLRSVSGRQIVTSNADLMVIRKVLKRTLRAKGAQLHAGYIAEQEVHLVIRIGETPLSAFTGRFQHEYARIFNASHGKRGSLFRLHHRSLLIDHRRWLVPLVHFVHSIGRMESVGTGSACVRWSSDAVYRGDAREDWVTTNVMLRMLKHGAYSRAAQVQAYRELMSKEPDARHVRLFRYGSPEDPRILGDEEFILETWRSTGRRAASASGSGDPEQNIRRVAMRSISEFNALCKTRSQPQIFAWIPLLTCENLLSGSRRRPLPMGRALIASYLVGREVATVTQAAVLRL
jgi:REP element-mobilizing transposase RayT